MTSSDSTTEPQKVADLRGRMAEAVLLDIGRAASVHEVTAFLGRLMANTQGLLTASPQVMHVNRNLWAVPEVLGLSQNELETFLEARKSASDDVGIISEKRLRTLTVDEPWYERLEELLTETGCVQRFGFWLVSSKRQALVKAVVKRRQRPTTTSQVLRWLPELDKLTVASAMSGCPSLLRVAPHTYKIIPKYYPLLVDAMQHDGIRAPITCHIDEGAIVRKLPSYITRWTPQLEELALASGYYRLFGYLVEDRDIYKCSMVIGYLNRPATTKEIAELANEDMELLIRWYPTCFNKIETTDGRASWTLNGEWHEPLALALEKHSDPNGVVDEDKLRSEIQGEPWWVEHLERCLALMGCVREAENGPLLPPPASRD